MNLRMAVDARIEGSKMALAVTFETEGPNIGADQKKSICRSVRLVATAAPLHFDGCVFKDPGASLLGVAFKTGVFIRKFIPLSQTRSRSGPVRGMAIRTFEGAFKDLMSRGEIEFRLDVLVAGQAQIGFFAFQHLLGAGITMNLMAVIAPHGCQLMDPPPKLKKFLLPLMAGQAGIGPNSCILILERKDEPFSLCLRMFFSGPVARFTSLLFECDFGIGEISPVGGISLKCLIEVRVALLANLGSDISTPPGLLSFLPEGGKRSEGYQNGQGSGQRQKPSRIHT